MIHGGERGNSSILVALVASAVLGLISHAINARLHARLDEKMQATLSRAGHSANASAMRLAEALLWTPAVPGTNCGVLSKNLATGVPAAKTGRNWRYQPPSGGTPAELTVNNCNGLRTAPDEVQAYFAAGAHAKDDGCVGNETRTVLTIERPTATSPRYKISAVTTVSAPGGRQLEVKDRFFYRNKGLLTVYNQTFSGLYPTRGTEYIRRAGGDASGPADVTVVGGHTVQAGDVYNLTGAAGRAYYRIHGAQNEYLSCPNGWGLHFQLADGSIVPNTSAGHGLEAIPAGVQTAAAPAGVVKAWVGFHDCGNGPFNCYFDNEPNRSPSSSTGGCALNLSVTSGSVAAEPGEATTDQCETWY